MDIKENETQFDIVIQKMRNLWIAKAGDTIWMSPWAPVIPAMLITAFMCGYFELQSSVPFVMFISPIFAVPIIIIQRLIKYVYIKNTPSLIDFNKNLSDIQTTRDFVAEEYERLIRLFEIDIMTPGIDNESIVDIKKSIDNIVIIMNKYKISLS